MKVLIKTLLINLDRATLVSWSPNCDHQMVATITETLAVGATGGMGTFTLDVVTSHELWELVNNPKARMDIGIVSLPDYR